MFCVTHSSACNLLRSNSCCGRSSRRAPGAPAPPCLCPDSPPATTGSLLRHFYAQGSVPQIRNKPESLPGVSFCCPAFRLCCLSRPRPCSLQLLLPPLRSTQAPPFLQEALRAPPTPFLESLSSQSVLLWPFTILWVALLPCQHPRWGASEGKALNTFSPLLTALFWMGPEL